MTVEQADDPLIRKQRRPVERSLRDLGGRLTETGGAVSMLLKQQEQQEQVKQVRGRRTVGAEAVRFADAVG
jgi:DNA-binding MarR family transcriptional regulator